MHYARKCMHGRSGTNPQPACRSLTGNGVFMSWKETEKFWRSLSWDYDDIKIKLLGSQKN